jgi:hypothetical protein
MSRQPQIGDPSCVPRHLDRRVTHHEHAREIQRRYGYRDFHAQVRCFPWSGGCIHALGSARSAPASSDRLRRAPTRGSGPAVAAACKRLEEIRTIGVSDLAFDHLPPNRLRDLARYGAAAEGTGEAVHDDRRDGALLWMAFAGRVGAQADA